MNKRVLNYWYVYLASAVVVSIFSCYLVDLINAPRNEETLSVFVGSFDDNSKEIQDKIFESLDYPYLREVNVRAFKITNSNFNQVYSTIGHSNSDVVIIPYEKIKLDVVGINYDIFESDILNSYFPSIQETYKINEHIYGLKIHSKGEQSSSSIKWSKDGVDYDYYAFVKKNIIHTNISRGGQFDTAYKVIENIYAEIV